MTEKYAPRDGDYIKMPGNKRYLPVPSRVQWFRGEHPDWSIITSVYTIDFEGGYAVMRAEVLDDTGRIIASGMKAETRKGFGDFIEKAETGAVGRALARAGYGTEDALDLEGDRLADAPIGPTEQPQGGERGAAREAQPATTRSAAQPTRYRRNELAALMLERGLDTDALEVYAAALGIPKTERPMSNASMDALIDAVRGHGTDEPIEPAVTPAADEEGAPGASEAPALAGAPPPKPGTDEFRALTSQERLNARAYWSGHPEDDETLAEQLRVPA